MQCIVMPSQHSGGVLQASASTESKTAFFRMQSLLCWHYLSSRQVTLQVLSTRMSLTSVFGMGTGGPSPQSIPTMWMGVTHLCICQSAPRSNSFWIIAPFCSLVKRSVGDPYRIRTDVKGVRGLCLNHLTNGPLVHLHGLEPGTH